MVKFANIIFKGLTREDIFCEDNKLKVIIPTNAELIVKAQSHNKFKTIISDNFATFDGQIPYFFAKRQNQNIHIEKISGSDLIYDFCNFAQKKNKSIFLLGGLEISNSRSVTKLRSYYQIEINGYSPIYKPYPFDEKHNKTILDEIRKFKPDILFVGFGAMKQELWIEDNRKELEEIGIKWVIGSGGTFEFVADKIKRAPLFIQRIGMEGIWRLLNEPKWFRVKRILVSFLIFKYIWR
jgi:N-acetylglucosaminyldiphosphoundecaprenol N-acetyl-beta-D-mannosaminyltransferase